MTYIYIYALKHKWCLNLCGSVFKNEICLSMRPARSSNCYIFRVKEIYASNNDVCIFKCPKI